MEALNWVNFTLEGLSPGPSTKLLEYYRVRELSEIFMYVYILIRMNGRWGGGGGGLFAQLGQLYQAAGVLQGACVDVV